MSELKEAQAADAKAVAGVLGVFGGAHVSAAFDRLLVVIEAAQQEAEAWKTIENWRDREPHARSCSLCISGCPAEAMLTRVNEKYEPTIQRFTGSTRLEALTKAAALCRAELAK